MSDLIAKAIAIYLPQFHPIPENDEWWGKGFTEWTNVTKAKPLFKGHYQPHLPADLGFYDLRLEESRSAQAEMAKEYGIHGFCYYHYWFNGKRVLNTPVDKILNLKKPDFPFMLFWANETWSRSWWGDDKEILIEQTYNYQDDLNHINWLCDSVFSDERYIKIYNRPAFIIYRPHHLPDYKRTIDIFKEVALKKGLPEPYLIASNSHSTTLEGFDNILNFEPQLSLLPGAFNDKSSLKKRLNNLKSNVYSSKLKVYDYADVKKIMALKKVNSSYLPCVFVGWDNTARRGEKGIIMHNQNENDFKESLLQAVEIVKLKPEEERLIFINAWNEWAEGNHLEPCQKYGFRFLDAVKQVFKSEQ